MICEVRCINDDCEEQPTWEAKFYFDPGDRWQPSSLELEDGDIDCPSCGKGGEVQVDGYDDGPDPDAAYDRLIGN